MALRLHLYSFFALLCTFVGFGQSFKVSSFEGDAGTALKRAMASSYDTIILDKRPEGWTFGPTRIKGARNKILLIEEGVEIKAKQNAFLKSNDALFQFIQCEGIEIIGNKVTITMNKEEYTEGEWRHGISLREVKDFIIKDLTICNSGGDGIYIAGLARGSFSKNVLLERIHSINNKRQGISIISGSNIKISDCVFSDTKGTLPGAGLDIEPNNEEDIIRQIEVVNSVFQNNYRAGIMLALGKLKGSSEPVSIVFRNCRLKNNHSPENKKAAAEIIFGASKDDPVKGDVLFKNCIVESSNWGLFYSRKRADAYQVSFIDCAAINICAAGSWPPIYLEVPDYRQVTGPLGGYSFENLYLEYSSEVPFAIVRGSRLGTLSGLQNIKGDVTISGSGAENIKYINYDPKLNREVNLEITRKH